MDDYKMDRTITTKLTFEQADNYATFYKDKTPIELLNYACDIINSIFNINPDLKVDWTIISSRKHGKSY